MSKLDLSGRNAFVTGVADDQGFAWEIAKALQAAGANVYLASHPRVVSIVERFLDRDKYAESRKLPYGVEGELKPAALFGCDVGYDTNAEIPEEQRATKGYEGDVSIAGAMQKFRELTNDGPLDILIHSVAFSPEIQKTHMETSRGAYLTAQSISAYSLVGLTRAALPMMKKRGGSVVGLTYLASTRMTPGYGGGMASAKASLECDTRALAWFAGEFDVRVNLVSAGPYASRAARSIGAIDSMIEMTKAKSPLRREIGAADVADATLFLCSPMARSITGEILHVDCGFHVMSAV
jgi:enoyl-[acyl-carrier protein] reductase I